MCLINRCKTCGNIILLPCNTFCSEVCEKHYNIKIYKLNKYTAPMPLYVLQDHSIKKIEPQLMTNFRIELPLLNKLK